MYDWVNFVSGGARIFVPGGSSSPQAYEDLYLLAEETQKLMDIDAMEDLYEIVTFPLYKSTEETPVFYVVGEISARE